MRSKKENLIKRGFVEVGVEKSFSSLVLMEKVRLLQSTVATERTIGARLLTHEQENVAEALVAALKVEKKLYPKLEIAKALIAHRRNSVKMLSATIGKIGNNQHQAIPVKEFGKNSYPLPRDIAARVLAKMGKIALPELIKVIKGSGEKMVSEAIDAIGFICFYSPQPQVLKELKSCFYTCFHHQLICWKIVMAMSGFPESISFLKEVYQTSQDRLVRREIIRSLRILETRKNKSILVHESSPESA